MPSTNSDASIENANRALRTYNVMCNSGDEYEDLQWYAVATHLRSAAQHLSGDNRVFVVDRAVDAEFRARDASRLHLERTTN